MEQVSFVSDYSPTTRLIITQTDDGDIILKIRGDGEMRFATSGGSLHGTQLVCVTNGFTQIMNALQDSSAEAIWNSLCYEPTDVEVTTAVQSIVP